MKTLILDMVCGEELPKETKYRVFYSGVEFFFCSEACADIFEADPQEYITE